MTFLKVLSQVLSQTGAIIHVIIRYIIIIIII